MSATILQELGGLALFVAPLAVALSWGATLAHRTVESEGRRHLAIFLCFCAYVTLVATLTLAPPPVSMSNGRFGTNVVPLVHSISCFVPDPGQPSTTEFCLRTIVGNVVIFVPLGFLLPLLSLPMRSAIRVLMGAAVGSLTIELLQFAGRWVGNYRWSDVDDVIFNVVGAMAGYGLLLLLTEKDDGLRNQRKKRDAV